MFVTRNRVSLNAVLLLMVVCFVTACGPPGPRALLQGRKLLEAGETEAAVKELKTAVSLLPTNAAAWNYLGLAYHRAGLSTNAIDAYSRAIKLDRELLEARFNLGCLLLDENRLDAAKTEFTAYTLRRGTEPEGWLKLGLSHLRGRDAGNAEKCFREALRLETNNVEALNGLGLAQLQRNRPREAAGSFASALEVKPDYRPALLNLATVSHQQLNDPAQALRRYREYLALQPPAADWDSVNAIVRALEQPTPVAQPMRTPANNPISNAIPSVVTLTNQSKSSTQQAAATKTAAVLKPLSNSEAVKPVPSPAMTAPPPIATRPTPEVVKLAPEPVIKPGSAESKPSIANSNSPPRPITSATNSPPKTERRGFLSKLNPFKSESKPAATNQASTGMAVSAMVERTSTSTASGRYAYLSPAAPKAGDRREAEAVLTQGQQAQRADRNVEAFQFFRRSVQLDPSYFEAYYCLGLTAFKIRSFQTALTAWENALALRPNDSDARYNFALTLKAAEYPRDAADELERLLSLHPDEARGHLTLGNLYADQLRDIPRARKHYNKVLQLDPRNPQAQAIRYWLVANPG